MQKLAGEGHTFPPSQMTRWMGLPSRDGPCEENRQEPARGLPKQYGLKSGFLRCAAHDKTVSSFGRNDDWLVWSLFWFCQGLQDGFVDLQGYAGVAVGDFSDFVLSGDADELGDLGWGELVVVGEPLGHVAGGVAEGVVEGAGVAEGDDGLWGFDADRGEALAGDEVDGELDVHGGLEGVAVDLAVALDRVAVADVEERAGVGDGQVDGGSFGDFVEVEVATPVAGVACGWRRACGSGCGGDAAEHR